MIHHCAGGQAPHRLYTRVLFTTFFARAGQDNGAGTVHHVVWDEALSRRARRHLEVLGYGDLVRYHVGEAVQALQASAGPFDLIFNDIDKEGRPCGAPP